MAYENSQMKHKIAQVDFFDMDTFEYTAEVILKTNPYMKNEHNAWLNDKQRLVDYMVWYTKNDMKYLSSWGTCGFYIHLMEDCTGRICAKAYPDAKMVLEYINGLTK